MMSDGDLYGVTHVILDEVHERDTEIDFLLTKLREQLKDTNCPFKLILMSATMDADIDMFRVYFSSLQHVSVDSGIYEVVEYYREDVLRMTGRALAPQTFAPFGNGFTMPQSVADFTPEPSIELAAEPFTGTMVDLRPDMSDHDLLKQYGFPDEDDGPDLDLVLSILNIIVDSPIEGAVLVFLTGHSDIASMEDKIKEASSNWKINPVIHRLHSEMVDNGNEHSMVFQHAKEGTRKVILSTNIAEASLTIDDVVFVIDSGKVKEKTYQPECGTTRLLCVNISETNAIQRKGRAGRCQKGYCFRVFSRGEMAMMKPNRPPALLRIAIQDVCLQAKLLAPCNMKAHEFLRLTPTPPSLYSIECGVERLKLLGALTPEEDMTQLGRTLAVFPLEPSVARMLLMGVALRCLDPIVTLAALLSKSPLILPRNDQRHLANYARQNLAQYDMSDHLLLLRAFYGFNEALKAGRFQCDQFCKQYFLSRKKMEMVGLIKHQLLRDLSNHKFLSSSDYTALNVHSSSWPLVKAAITFGAYPKIGFVHEKQCIRTSADRNSSLHPSSTLALNKSNVGVWVAFEELIDSKNGKSKQVRSVSAVSPSAIALFAGPSCLSQKLIEKALHYEYDPDIELGIKEEYNLFELDDLNAMKLPSKSSRCLMQLRLKVHTHFMDMLRNPGQSETAGDLLITVRKFLEEEDERYSFPKFPKSWDHRQSIRKVQIDQIL